ncbi:MAG: SDR family oxidoreductase [Chloroflexi bacterium]|nr:MAG: SDR family oxidoreductase [Chloroflexota bacterium]
MTFIITGGASGIGFATAQLLKQYGQHVVIWDVNADQLKIACEQLEVAGELVDCTQYEQLQHAITQIETITGVIHCAGVLRTGLFEDVSIEDHIRMVNINLTGTLLTAKAALPALKKSRGHLILVASVSAFQGPPEFASYAATKAGVYSFAQSLRVELHGSGVHLGVVFPNLVNTPMLNAENRRHAALTNAKSIFLKTYQPEEIAAKIVAGIHKRRFMIFPDWRTRLVYWASRYAAWTGHFLTLKIWQNAKKTR